MAQDLVDAVAEVIRRTFAAPYDEVVRSTVSFDIDGWDSLSHATLIMEIERRFRISITGDEAANLGNVGDLVDLVAAKLAARERD